MKNFAEIAFIASLLSAGKRLHFVRRQAIAWQQDPSLFSFTPHRFAWILQVPINGTSSQSRGGVVSTKASQRRAAKGRSKIGVNGRKIQQVSSSTATKPSQSPAAKGRSAIGVNGCKF